MSLSTVEVRVENKSRLGHIQVNTVAKHRNGVWSQQSTNDENAPILPILQPSTIY